MTNKVWMLGIMLVAFLVGTISCSADYAGRPVGRYQLSPPDMDSNGIYRIDTVTGQYGGVAVKI